MRDDDRTQQLPFFLVRGNDIKIVRSDELEKALELLRRWRFFPYWKDGYCVYCGITQLSNTHHSKCVAGDTEKMLADVTGN